MKRQMYSELLKWKNKDSKKPLIIFGARQVGKTYLVEKFAKDNYDYFYSINFEFEKDAKKIFAGNLDIETLLIQLTSYKTHIPIIKGKTLLFFDEAQTCPDVLTALKTFALDKRFDVIASVSMLGISLSSVSSYPVGYVETLNLKSMSFREFLWANGYSDDLFTKYYDYFEKGISVPNAIHEKLNTLFLHYIVVGGMPEAVLKYIETKNIGLVLEVQKRIINDYRNDVAKYTTKVIREKVKLCFDSIPDQLAKENKKFQYKFLKTNGTSRTFLNSVNWIVDAGLGSKVERLKTFDIPLKAYRDINMFKLYLNDSGLLLAFYNENVSYEIINGNLGIFKGGIFENIIAKCLLDNNLEIYYYLKNDSIEVDFITTINNKVVPIEVKSGKNTRAVSIKNLIEKENLEYGIILSLNNINYSNPKIRFIPLYMVMFLK